ncbi:hypothetical protein [Flavilitoribacter nigricans]|uniref:Uncharacterized protein n=1 Tax=Flavilitoribacter nigricans (strain ATCC 23147 / DSM 23189 / NBRC 102662 / NCIMB 1420 / SS-2) TaxID=1122177 RepID=A0A2D0NIP2_FLAN2|nr:hypothetical protein [Flavilitoribacter nigricans]PHN08260.1 hypothetical protein CRP01_02755 [Flavilitoribacter nigricans DSM 23189 = NBRC 102662]
MAQLLKTLFLLTAIALVFTACTKESAFSATDDLEIDQRIAPLAQSIPVDPVLGSSAAKASKSLAIWSDCEGFATIGTPTSFKPSSGNFDELYTGANFAGGLGAISESKPGDQDFNGGRWHVNTLKAGVDPDKYLEACSVEDIDTEDFVSTTTYFECPLLPVRGKGHN